jgi:hypothetical protein
MQMINFNQIKNFIQVPSQSNSETATNSKSVLRVKNNVLSIVPLKETTFFERIQAWFGFGPLSLSNISDFLSRNIGQIQRTPELTGTEKQNFFDKIHVLADTYNKHHTICKIKPLALDKILGASTVFYHKDATYNTEGIKDKVIDDVSYADAKRGFGYVVDGTGHNNETMATVLDKIFTSFNKLYTSAYDEIEFNTSEEYQHFIQGQIQNLGLSIHNEPEPVLDDPRKPGMTHMDDDTLKPAFSFAQLGKIGNQNILFSCQYSDTMILIKKANGNFDETLAKGVNGKARDDFGIGTQNQRPSPVIATTVEPGDIVYGFSDGIGEFLTLEECKECLSANIDPGTLLDELKEKILSRSGQTQPSFDQRIKAANGKTLKYHDWDDKGLHDDISLFGLVVK